MADKDPRKSRSNMTIERKEELATAVLKKYGYTKKEIDEILYNAFYNPDVDPDEELVNNGT